MIPVPTTYTIKILWIYSAFVVMVYRNHEYFTDSTRDTFPVDVDDFDEDQEEDLRAVCEAVFMDDDPDDDPDDDL